MTASTAPSPSHKKGLVMPAAKEHARFFEQYYDAAKTSQPDAYFKAALLAKQWEQAIFVELRAAAELALAADAEIAELRIDAERYRWLRDEIDSGGNVALCEWFTYTNRGAHWSPIASYCEEYVDRARAALATPLEAKS